MKCDANLVFLTQHPLPLVRRSAAIPSPFSVSRELRVPSLASIGATYSSGMTLTIHNLSKGVVTDSYLAISIIYYGATSCVSAIPAFLPISGSWPGPHRSQWQQYKCINCSLSCCVKLCDLFLGLAIRWIALLSIPGSTFFGCAG